MSNNRPIRKDHLVLFAVISILVIASSSISNDGNKFVYSQLDLDQVNFNITILVDMQDIPLKKVSVGDIDIAYKTFGNGDPILLISGSGNVMDVWPSSMLQELSSNHTVIIFDHRGVGNTTSGSKPITIQQLANDSIGLLDALGLQRADVLGFSMGSFVAEQFMTYPPRQS